jgi:hypothetical protein
LKPLRVLFVGNSYTFFNEMPAMVAELAHSAREPRPLQYELAVEGGVTLEWHQQQPRTLERIDAGPWDDVVLQEQSLRPVDEAERFYTYGQRLIDRVTVQGARPVLYLTWARQGQPAMQTALNRAYTELARRTGAVVAPVGVAWQRALEADPELPLYTEDGSHPTALGSYLAACVFYTVLYGESAVGLARRMVLGGETLVDLSREQAVELQRIAWESC